MTLKEYLQSLIDNKETDVEKLQKALIEATGAIDEAVETANYALTKLAAERKKSARIEKETVERCAQITLVIGCNAHPANHKQYYEACEHVAEVLRHDYAAIRALGEKE